MGPLAGIKVIELGGIGPAPFGASLLADLGAEVIRVGRVGDGSGLPRELDPTRSSAGARLGVDLKDPEGLALAIELIGSADIVIEGFRPGVVERLGLGPDRLTDAYPRLIYARMTGWGQEGPMAGAAGHDINYSGLVGALHATGRADDRPVPALNLVADYGGGALYLAVGVLAALHGRDESGEGDVIDVAMVDGVASMMGPTFRMLAAGFWIDGREANLLDGGAPFYTTYETADGRYMAVGALEPVFYNALLEGLDLEASDLPERFDPSYWPELRSKLAERFITRTRDEWSDHFAGRDACVTPVLSLTEVAIHPHHVARGTFIERDGRPVPAPAPRFASSQAERRHQSDVASTPAEILAAAGVSRTRIEAALQAGIVD
jgi:alpha-methylacyl-CoA racemase